jgi:hypothetical protein
MTGSLGLCSDAMILDYEYSEEREVAGVRTLGDVPPERLPTLVMSARADLQDRKRS